MNPDYSKLDPELQDKIKQWQANNPQNKSLTYLSDIADMLQALLGAYDEDKKEDEREEKEKGAILLDIREALQGIAGKEDKEMPDYAKPIVKAIDSLEQKLAAKDFNPTIKVDAPKVTVPTPVANVTVDTPAISTRGIENVIRKELSTAFKEAIALIPPTEIPEPADRWDEVLEWLKSIDTASRMKPQAPTRIAVTNLDGTSTSNGFAENATITTDLSTPGIIVQTDGVKTYTATITSTSITEVWT